MTDSAQNGRPITPTRVAGALVGGALVGYAAGRRWGAGVNTAARLVGAGLVIAVLAPSLSRGLVRAGAERRRVRLRTTVIAERPVHDVFTFCHDFENFTRVIHSLRSVTDYQDGRSRWEVLSPSGEVLAWDVVVTKYVPNVVIGWRSVPGSVVYCSGLIRFIPLASSTTRLDIEIRYDPGHTGLADALRALIEVRRQDQLKAELARANSLLRAEPPTTPGTESQKDRSSSSQTA